MPKCIYKSFIHIHRDLNSKKDQTIFKRDYTGSCDGMQLLVLTTIFVHMCLDSAVSKTVGPNEYMCHFRGCGFEP